MSEEITNDLTTRLQKRVDFKLVKGHEGSGATIVNDDGEYDPDSTVSIARGVGKCPNCSVNNSKFRYLIDLSLTPGRPT